MNTQTRRAGEPAAAPNHGWSPGVPACCPSPPVTGGEWPGSWLGRIPAHLGQCEQQAGAEKGKLPWRMGPGARAALWGQLLVWQGDALTGEATALQGDCEPTHPH